MYEEVRPLPNTADSTAFVYLKDDRLARDRCLAQTSSPTCSERFLPHARNRDEPSGQGHHHLGLLTLVGNESRPDLALAPLQPADKIQWDSRTRSNQPMTPDEANAYTQLSAKLAAQPDGMSVKSRVR